MTRAITTTTSIPTSQHALPKIRIKDAGSALPVVGNPGDHESWVNDLSKALGTGCPNEAITLLDQVINASVKAKQAGKEVLANAIISMLAQISPNDSAERMLACQMIAAHFLAMDFLRRAVSTGFPESGQNFVKVSTRLMRTYAQQLEALRRYRNRGQHIKVEHVHVHEGGQAIVGNINNQ